ncbi:TetR/AcrR family transcriptional regulator [Streptomyces sp. NPDC090025]|uniref:TetR/AcrR family transcriptional regulator n=1 Tax=Streptomyces sp. NPDC090025 TaxID=3365922 RepID=UPI003833E2EE
MASETSPGPSSEPGRRTRKDAARNQRAVLAAADALFARSDRPEELTMADIAAAAGVGKGTLFRAFGDRAGLLRALYEARLEPVREAVTSGPPPLGPGAPARERAAALLDAVLCFKLDNRPLALALEDSGTGPYQAEHYARWHELLRSVLAELPGLPEPGFTAHALLAAVRADLVELLAGREAVPREELRAALAGYVERVTAPAARPAS